ncbi:MAG: hypothetical protein SFV18_13020 [Bryobacteraceae bacterium]|nr:hypothetical protein [Bryobacteraceae bacterium]
MRAALLLVPVLAFGQAKVTQHMMLLEPSGTDLAVSETLIVEGAGKVQVFLPPDAELAGTRGGKAVKTAKPGVYDVTLDAAQGPESRVDVNWSMPFVSPETLNGRILHGGGPVRLVFPKGVTAKGAALESNGVEPTTQAQIYTLKGSSFKIEINGAGKLRAQRPEAEEAGEDDGPRIEQIMPRLYDRLPWILGLTLGVLAIGFALHFRARVG